jgi:hypothetical protein
LVLGVLIYAGVVFALPLRCTAQLPPIDAAFREAILAALWGLWLA